MGDSPRAALELRDVRVVYRLRWSRLTRANREIVAVDNVSFAMSAGETVAVVGESGSGKSTIARSICGLVRHGGSVLLDGEELATMSRDRRRAVSPHLQMVFQNPYSSLDPAMTIQDSISEPLEIHTELDKAERSDRVAHLLKTVGLDPTLASRYPRALSGGQRQRVAIARAIALDPHVLICDEAVSALDVSTQTQVVALLRNLVKELGISCLFITHDLGLVPDIADRVLIVYAGRIVEEGPIQQVFTAPQHPYTKVLLDAVPVPDPRVQRGRVAAIPAEPATSLERPTGCAFHPRCPIADDNCSVHTPRLDEFAIGHRVACHLVPTSVGASQ